MPTWRNTEEQENSADQVYVMWMSKCVLVVQIMETELYQCLAWAAMAEFVIADEDHVPKTCSISICTGNSSK